MELSELVRQYKEGGAFQRNELISKTLAGFKFKLLRRLVKRAYLKADYLENISFHGHRDAAYFKKLLGWAIVERSGQLDNEHITILARHRTNHLAKGPNINADPDTSILDLGITNDKEGSDMETKKKSSAAKAEKKKTAKASAKAHTKKAAFAPDSQFVLKSGHKFKGGMHAALNIFETPTTVAAAHKHFEELFAEKKIKSKVEHSKAFEGNLRWAIGQGFLRPTDGNSTHSAETKATKKAAKAANPTSETKTKVEKEAEATKTA